MAQNNDDRATSRGLWRFANEFHEAAKVVDNSKGKALISFSDDLLLAADKVINTDAN